MWDIILGTAAAIGGALFADAVVKEKTGRHIHQHVFEWWCGLRDYIAAWLNQNQHLGITRIGLIVLDAFDDFAVRTKQTSDRITLGVIAIDRNETVFDVATQEVSAAEVIEMFPGFRETAVLIDQVAN
jgi:hypothetical protein